MKLISRVKLLIGRCWLFFLLWPQLSLANSNLANPLGAGANLQTLVANFIKGILGIVSLLALVNLIWAGLDFILDRGKGEKKKLALDNIRWTITGLFLLFSAYAIVGWLIATLGEVP